MPASPKIKTAIFQIYHLSRTLSALLWFAMSAKMSSFRTELFAIMPKTSWAETFFSFLSQKWLIVYNEHENTNGHHFQTSFRRLAATQNATANIAPHAIACVENA